jgi:hypothetical protein
MKITVDLSDIELKDVMRFTGERKKGPAIRKFVISELMLKRREDESRRVMSGDWRIDLAPWQELRTRDKADVWRR